MLFRSDRKSTRLNSSHTIISYAVFCLKKKTAMASPQSLRPAFTREGAGATGRTLRGRRGRGDVRVARGCIGGGSGGIGEFFFNDGAATDAQALSLQLGLAI